MNDVTARATAVVLGGIFWVLAWCRVRPVARRSIPALGWIQPVRDALVLLMIGTIFFLIAIVPTRWAYAVPPIVGIVAVLYAVSSVVLWKARRDARVLKASLGLPVLAPRAPWWVAVLAVLAGLLVLEVLVVLGVAVLAPSIVYQHGQAFTVMILAVQTVGIIAAAGAGAAQWMRGREREEAIRRADRDFLDQPQSEEPHDDQ